MVEREEGVAEMLAMWRAEIMKAKPIMIKRSDICKKSMTQW